jgi:hypothetical protein
MLPQRREPRPHNTLSLKQVACEMSKQTVPHALELKPHNVLTDDKKGQSINWNVMKTTSHEQTFGISSYLPIESTVTNGSNASVVTTKVCSCTDKIATRDTSCLFDAKRRHNYINIIQRFQLLIEMERENF